MAGIIATILLVCWACWVIWSGLDNRDRYN